VAGEDANRPRARLDQGPPVPHFAQAVVAGREQDLRENSSNKDNVPGPTGLVSSLIVSTKIEVARRGLKRA